MDMEQRKPRIRYREKNRPPATFCLFFCLSSPFVLNPVLSEFENEERAVRSLDWNLRLIFGFGTTSFAYEAVHISAANQLS